MCEYFVALTGDVMERFAPSSVFIEALSRLGFPMPPKRQAEIDERCQYLLSLCFNPASIALANDGGMDGEGFRQTVLDFVQPRLMAAVKTDGGEERASQEWIDDAFDGQLKSYIDISRAHLTALWLQVTDIMRDGGAEVHMSLVNEERSYTHDLDVALNERCDRVCYEPRGEVTAAEVEELRSRGAEGAKVLYYWDRHLESEEEATAILASAVDSGCDGATVYNYGLLTERQLGNIGAAIKNVGGG